MTDTLTNGHELPELLTIPPARRFGVTMTFVTGGATMVTWLMPFSIFGIGGWHLTLSLLALTTVVAVFAIWTARTTRRVVLTSSGIDLPSGESIPWWGVESVSCYTLNWVPICVIKLTDGSKREIKWMYLGRGWEMIAVFQESFSDPEQRRIYFKESGGLH